MADRTATIKAADQLGLFLVGETLPTASDNP
jgi:hypothetical protein